MRPSEIKLPYPLDTPVYKCKCPACREWIPLYLSRVHEKRFDCPWCMELVEIISINDRRRRVKCDWNFKIIEGQP